MPSLSKESSPETDGDFQTSPNRVDFESGKDALGAGLKNEVGEYNCFLNVIIQVWLPIVLISCLEPLTGMSFCCFCLSQTLMDFFSYEKSVIMEFETISR